MPFLGIGMKADLFQSYGYCFSETKKKKKIAKNKCIIFLEKFYLFLWLFVYGFNQLKGILNYNNRLDRKHYAEKG